MPNALSHTNICLTGNLEITCKPLWQLSYHLIPRGTSDSVSSALGPWLRRRAHTHCAMHMCIRIHRTQNCVHNTT
jgi:hypothetical protein